MIHSDEEYDALPGINYSTIKWIVTHSLLHSRVKREPGPAASLGAAFHVKLLQPELFGSRYVLRPTSVDYRTKIGKAWRERAIADGKSVLSCDDMQSIENMANSVMNHRVARDLLVGDGRNELAMTWVDRDHNVRCKGRIDRLACAAGKSPKLVGVKTIHDIRPYHWCRSILEYSYHVQWAYYVDGLVENQLAHPGDLLVYEILVENSPPYDVAVELVGHDWLDEGRRQYKKALKVVADEGSMSQESIGIAPHLRTTPMPEWCNGEDDE